MLSITDGDLLLYGLALLGLAHNSAWYYPQTDTLGSIRQWTTAAGAGVGSASYDPFGGELSRQGFTSPWGFAGEYHDPTTGLQYLRARWYNPAIGRFTQVDPFPGVLALPLTQHPYVYGLNSPTNLTDPTGKDPLSLAGTLIAGVVGGFVTGVGFYTIQVMLQAQVCSSTPPWDWRVALRWGLAGAAIGSTFVLTVWGLAELLNLGGLLFSGVLYETMPWLALAEARLAQGLLGGLAAGIGYTIPAVIFGTFDNRELAVAIMIGGFMGAYPEFLGSTPGQAILRGALSNELQYIGSGIITENRAALTSVSGHLSSVILGGVIGKLQGPSLMPGLQNVAAHTIGYAGFQEVFGRWTGQFLREAVDEIWDQGRKQFVRSATWEVLNNLLPFLLDF